jgi:hypothetical protein
MRRPSVSESEVADLSRSDSSWTVVLSENIDVFGPLQHLDVFDASGVSKRAERLFPFWE